MRCTRSLYVCSASVHSLFFRDLVIPYVIALFLMYLLRPLARMIKGSLETCFRKIVCCRRCVDHPEDEEEVGSAEEDAEEGKLAEPLTSRGKKNKMLEILKKRRNRKICDCAHILSFMFGHDPYGASYYIHRYHGGQHHSILAGWQAKQVAAVRYRIEVVGRHLYQVGGESFPPET